jgi:hypothetical protein
MIETLAVKQPRLVNRSAPLLLHDNARPHTAQQTATKLEEVQLEYLRHPLYSPDRSNSLQFFFEIWITSCKGKKSIPMGHRTVQIVFKDFILYLPRFGYNR